jgi:hypothetical protein
MGQRHGEGMHGPTFICSILTFVGPSFSFHSHFSLLFLFGPRPTCTKEDHKTIEILEAYPTCCRGNCRLVDTWYDDVDKNMLICLTDVDIAVACASGFYLNWV